MLSAAKACVERSRLAQRADFLTLDLDPDRFSQVPDNSIDYGLLVELILRRRSTDAR